MLAFSNDYYGFIFRVTQSVELFCTYIAKAQEARIKSLEQKLSDSVPKNEYESLQKKYEELQVKYSQMKKGTLLKMYDQL